MNLIQKRIAESIEPFDSFTTEQKKAIWNYYETIQLKDIENEILDWFSQFIRENEVFPLLEHCLEKMTESNHSDERKMFRDLFRILQYMDTSDMKKIANIRALTDQGHNDNDKAIKEYLT